MYDYLIVGGGIIGLNIAKTLKEKEPTCKVVVIDKEPSLALHSSGRNSESCMQGFIIVLIPSKQNSLKMGTRRYTNFVKKKSAYQ